MKIRQINENSVWLLAKKEKLLINPTVDLIEKKKYDSRIALFCKEELDFLGLDSEKVIIMGPGEYEVGGVDISGYENGSESVLYQMNVEGVSVVIVSLGQEKLDGKLAEKIKGVDVMIVLGKDGKDDEMKSLLAVAKKWGVNYFVPVGVRDEGLKILLDEVDREDAKKEKELVVEKGNLPDGMEMVLLGGK